MGGKRSWAASWEEVPSKRVGFVVLGGMEWTTGDDKLEKKGPNLR